MSMTVRNHAALLGLLLGLPTLTAGCEGTECGPGTREMNGKCVPLSFLPGDGGVHCGLNTVLVGNECVPMQTICGEFTELVAELDPLGNPTGGFTCVGKPDETEENPPPPCTDEFGPAGEICINGWIHWLVDDASAIFVTSRMVDPDADEDATNMVVKVYDPLLYAEDPANAQPIAIGEVNPRWGTFRVQNVQVPGNGLIALVTDDKNDLVEDRWAMTGAPYGAVPYENSEGYVAFAVSQDQNTEWTEAIGGSSVLEAMGCTAPPVGQPHTLLSCGTWVGIFTTDVAEDSITTIEGVTASIPGGPIPEERTFYPGFDADGNLVFDDPTPGVVWTDDQGPHEYTGFLGSVFYPSASLQNMLGSCVAGTPCGDRICIWNELLGGSVPGALFVQFMIPITCNQ